MVFRIFIEAEILIWSNKLKQQPDYVKIVIRKKTFPPLLLTFTVYVYEMRCGYTEFIQRQLQICNAKIW